MNPQVEASKRDPDRQRRLLRHALLLLLGAIISCAAVALIGMEFENSESLEASLREQQRIESLAAVLAVEVGAELRTLSRDASIVTSPSGTPDMHAFLGRHIASVDDERGDDERGDDERGDDELGRAFTVRVDTSDGRTIRVDVHLEDLFHAADYLESIDEHVFVLPPGARGYLDLHGHRISAPGVERLVSARTASTVLPSSDAEGLGLADFPVIFSVQSVDGGALGTWKVAIARSTRLEQERDQRGILRVFIKVLFTGVAVALFGYFGFRDFRSELNTRHALELAEQRRLGEEALAQENRTATMLTLAAGVAHEVGTPLGLIRVKAESLREALIDSPEHSDATTILDQVDRLRDVVQGFLRVARGSTPEQMVVRPEPIARAVRDLVAHRFHAARVCLEVEIDEGVASLRASPLLVEHALINLLINACDASPREGTVMLRIREEGRNVLFEVLDEGEGIAAEEHALLLKPFLSRKVDGTGLGLAITNEIARIHRGSVTLEPRTPQGVIATLRLPKDHA